MNESQPVECAEDAEEMLAQLLTLLADDSMSEERSSLECWALEGAEVRTFAEAQLLTSDHGLVVTLASGQELQLTVQLR